MKYISKLPGEKWYAHHSERILDDLISTIYGFSTLAANSKPQITVRPGKKWLISNTYWVRRYLLVQNFCRKHQVVCWRYPHERCFPWLLRLLLLLLLIMECVRPYRSTCCQTDETPRFWYCCRQPTITPHPFMPLLIFRQQNAHGYYGAWLCPTKQPSR